jgi:hypothetical protein
MLVPLEDSEKGGECGGQMGKRKFQCNNDAECRSVSQLSLRHSGVYAITLANVVPALRFVNPFQCAAAGNPSIDPKAKTLKFLPAFELQKVSIRFVPTPTRDILIESRQQDLTCA